MESASVDPNEFRPIDQRRNFGRVLLKHSFPVEPAEATRNGIRESSAERPTGSRVLIRGQPPQCGRISAVDRIASEKFEEITSSVCDVQLNGP